MLSFTATNPNRVISVPTERSVYYGASAPSGGGFTATPTATDQASGISLRCLHGEPRGLDRKAGGTPTALQQHLLVVRPRPRERSQTVTVTATDGAGLTIVHLLQQSHRRRPDGGFGVVATPARTTATPPDVNVTSRG